MNCRNCARPLLPRKSRHKLCECCHSRWRRAGCPPDFHVPPPSRPRPASLDAAKEAHAADHAEWKAAVMAVFAPALKAGLPVKAAARRAGICYRTGLQYRQELIEAAEQQQGAA